MVRYDWMQETKQGHRRKVSRIQRSEKVFNGKQTRVLLKLKNAQKQNSKKSCDSFLSIDIYSNFHCDEAGFVPITFFYYQIFLYILFKSKHDFLSGCCAEVLLLLVSKATDFQDFYSCFLGTWYQVIFTCGEANRS